MGEETKSVPETEIKTGLGVDIQPDYDRSYEATLNKFREVVNYDKIRNQSIDVLADYNLDAEYHHLLHAHEAAVNIAGMHQLDDRAERLDSLSQAEQKIFLNLVFNIIDAGLERTRQEYAQSVVRAETGLRSLNLVDNIYQTPEVQNALNNYQQLRYMWLDFNVRMGIYGIMKETGNLEKLRSDDNEDLRDSHEAMSEAIAENVAKQLTVERESYEKAEIRARAEQKSFPNSLIEGIRNFRRHHRHKVLAVGLGITAVGLMGFSIPFSGFIVGGFAAASRLLSVVGLEESFRRLQKKFDNDRDITADDLGATTEESKTGSGRLVVGDGSIEEANRFLIAHMVDTASHGTNPKANLGKAINKEDGSSAQDQNRGEGMLKKYHENLIKQAVFNSVWTALPHYIDSKPLPDGDTQGPGFLYQAVINTQIQYDNVDYSLLSVGPAGGPLYDNEIDRRMNERRMFNRRAALARWIAAGTTSALIFEFGQDVVKPLAKKGLGWLVEHLTGNHAEAAGLAGATPPLVDNHQPVGPPSPPVEPSLPPSHEVFSPHNIQWTPTGDGHPITVGEWLNDHQVEIGGNTYDVTDGKIMVDVDIDHDGLPDGPKIPVSAENGQGYYNGELYQAFDKDTLYGGNALGDRFNLLARGGKMIEVGNGGINSQIYADSEGLHASHDVNVKGFKIDGQTITDSKMITSSEELFKHNFEFNQFVPHDGVDPNNMLAVADDLAHQYESVVGSNYDVGTNGELLNYHGDRVEGELALRLMENFEADPNLYRQTLTQGLDPDIIRPLHNNVINDLGLAPEPSAPQTPAPEPADSSSKLPEPAPVPETPIQWSEIVGKYELFPIEPGAEAHDDIMNRLLGATSANQQEYEQLVDFVNNHPNPDIYYDESAVGVAREFALKSGDDFLQLNELPEAISLNP